VKDNGIGFEGVSPGLGGNGLRNMKHRAEELKGSFEINSELNKGTTLSIQFAYS
jgi:signal transduction histidine kinase